MAVCGVLRCFQKRHVVSYCSALTTAATRNTPNQTSLFSRIRETFPCTAQLATVRTNSFDRVSYHVHQEIVKDSVANDKAFSEETFKLINDHVAKKEEGRLFAIIHVTGKQFKITQDDIIILQGYWPPQIGDQIHFEKVLLVGGSDFTLFGRPVLPPGVVSIVATIVDKDLSHVKTRFIMKKRKQCRRINLFGGVTAVLSWPTRQSRGVKSLSGLMVLGSRRRSPVRSSRYGHHHQTKVIRSPLTMVRINKIEIVGKVNERQDVEGVDQVFH